VAWGKLTSTAQSWTTQAATDQTWQSVGLTPSALRLTRVFAQDSALTVEDVSFIYRVQSEGAFLVATGSGIQIRSSITERI
jgi:hypothetical protein